MIIATWLLWLMVSNSEETQNEKYGRNCRKSYRYFFTFQVTGHLEDGVFLQVVAALRDVERHLSTENKEVLKASGK